MCVIEELPKYFSIKIYLVADTHIPCEAVAAVGAGFLMMLRCLLIKLSS